MTCVQFEPEAIRATLQLDGRVWLRGAIGDRELNRLDNLCAADDRPGARVSASDPLFHFVRGASFGAQIDEIWPQSKPVRIVSFDKSPKANWTVPWHQDRVIAVDRKGDMGGFTNWSQKGGIWHCEPPIKTLERMLFVRVHLDDNTADNGAMQIALGSDVEGGVSSQNAEEIAQKYPAEICTAKRGDILVLKMLTLHRSLPSIVPTNRRVLRIDYACHALPEPLQWFC